MISYTENSADYHASGAIGSGHIRDYLRSPRLFKDKRDGLVPESESPALVLGTLTHLAMLEPARFSAAIAVKPAGMSFATKDGKEWKAAYGGRTIITEADYGTIYMMQQRMPEEVRAALTSGQSEVTVRTELNGLPVQCRVDHWNRTGRVAYDLKTIDAIENVEREIHKRGYFVQGRFYQRVIAQETNEAPDFLLVFVEKSFPFRWRIAHLHEWNALADEKIDEALHGIAARTKSGDWSDPAPLHIYPELPQWLQSDITETDEGLNL